MADETGGAETPTGEKGRRNPLSVPISIVIAGALIAGALYLSAGKAPTEQSGVVSRALQSENSPSEPIASAEISIEPVTARDHILGNPAAEVIIVEFSDLECPWCKRFHPTLHAIVDEFGRDGKVAWVYRHFPLEQLHSKAKREAEAAECAAELAGNRGFWAFVDKIFEITPSNDGLDLSLLPKVAEDLGINRSLFESCLKSGRHKEKVEQQYQDAVRAGGRGTPYTVIITRNEKLPITEGAVPLSYLRNIIVELLKAKKPLSDKVP